MANSSEPTHRQWDVSHDTALCLIPPTTAWPAINRVRALYDKAYGRWPPHINLIYPFVRPEVIDDAIENITKFDISAFNSLSVNLDKPGIFSHRNNNTIYLQPAAGSQEWLRKLANTLRKAFNRPVDAGFQPHMTIAQSEDAESDSHKFLFNKVALMAPLSWTSYTLAVMVRDAQPEADGTKRMRAYKSIDLSNGHVSSLNLALDPILYAPKGDQLAPYTPLAQPSYRFDKSLNKWTLSNIENALSKSENVEHLIIASYNVLAEFQWPPNCSRYGSLVQNILSKRGAADILVLQEVSDSFLPHLLNNTEIQSRYPYSSNAPAADGVGPLPSLVNIVILSRFPLSWKYLPLSKKHKSVSVVTFPTVLLRTPQGEERQLVVVGCHLSQGLTDGAVTTKKLELLRILNYLREFHAQDPCVIAGDFNITTSSYAIEQAIRRDVLSKNGELCLQSIEQLFSTHGFRDAWLATRLEAGESSTGASSGKLITELFEGEQGATFDPMTNSQASKMVGSGFNVRPQRYDRIFSNNWFPFRPAGFNIFGQEATMMGEGKSAEVASDHWGIRCLFKSTDIDTAPQSNLLKPVTLSKAPTSLGDVEEIKNTLHAGGFIPSSEDRIKREQAIALLQKVLLQNETVSPPHDAHHSLQLILIPVGSFGLGVWMAESDVDCLCVGNISSKLFFTMATQRLRKASDSGITLLRRVKANSGTMLELDILGVKFDLQYCAASSVVENYPSIMNYPASHPSFSLPVQTLAKLKPARDMSYIQRSVPDLAQFRVAFLFIKAWAITHGLYGAKFGLLGGIHLAVLLVPICKELAQSTAHISTADIVTTFFDHYDSFDWAKQLVYDGFFHKDLKYHRISREPICLLGWHAPSLNTTMAFSQPTVKTIATEISNTRALLSTGDASWLKILDLDSEHSIETQQSGLNSFLASHRRFLKIDARYWGASPSRGRKFFGWLESRCVSLLVALNRKAPDVVPRIWPARFRDIAEGDVTNTTECNAYYLIGLSIADAVDLDKTKDDTRKVEASVTTAMQDFESRMRNDGKYYDKENCWMATSIIKSSQIGSLVVDTTSVVGGDDSDSEVSDDEEEANDEEYEEAMLAHLKKGKASSSIVPKPEGMGKFRSAADVLNRIRWDMSIDQADYIVGFEDRFVGAQEKALTQWKTEQTDEEFIPQHRILYFKQKSTSEIMWERRTRIDKIFGSGIQS